MSTPPDGPMSATAEGHYAIEFRRLDGHWCDIALVDRARQRGFHFGVELNDATIAELEAWIRQTKVTV